MKTIVDRQNMSIKKLLIVLAGALVALFLLLLTASGCIRSDKVGMEMRTKNNPANVSSSRTVEFKRHGIKSIKRTVLSDREGYVPYGSYPWLLIRRLPDQLNARLLTRLITLRFPSDSELRTALIGNIACPVNRGYPERSGKSGENREHRKKCRLG